MISDDSWRVKWWKYCSFTEADIDPGATTTVQLCDLVDCLWQDRVGRRKIKVKKERTDCQTQIEAYLFISLDVGLIPTMFQLPKIYYQIRLLFHLRMKSTRFWRLQRSS